MRAGVMPQGFMGSGNGSTFQQDPWDDPFLVSDMFFALYNTITGGWIAGGVEKVSIKLAAQKVAKAAAAKELKRKIRDEAAKSYSQATYSAFERQLAKDGMKSILKTQAKIQKNLAEHIQKLGKIVKAGGYSSSVEREIKTFQSQLAALKDLIK